MNIPDLIEELRSNHIQVASTAVSSAQVTQLCCDSRALQPGGVFFALPGVQFDGHDFIPQAVAAGASAVVMEARDIALGDVCGIRVNDVRAAMAYAARAFYHQPQRNMLVVGITGTNGKTTLSYMIEALLRARGNTPAVVGTISNRMQGYSGAASHTTPESLELYRLLAGFKSRGADALALEVSSHALEQNRVLGLDFTLGVFTNLTPEHLDYHADMEEYFAAKTKLFSAAAGYGCERAVINIADPYGARLAAQVGECIKVDPRVKNPADADIQVLAAEYSLDGIKARLQIPEGVIELCSPLIGPFNLENLCCAVGAGLALGLSAEQVGLCLEQVEPVPGRLERVENALGALILVDYAHTSDALEKALEAVHALNPGRLITVFGCGGDRDKRKRPLMGAAAAQASSLAVVTSDNPRTEDPGAIIQQIVAGIKPAGVPELDRAEAAAGRQGYCVIQDRAEALRFAVSMLRRGDVLLVAGKGHEDYQIIGTTKQHFDDREQLRAALAEM